MQHVSFISAFSLSASVANTCKIRYSTALLIGEKAAILVAEDLGYSGEALKMEVPTYNAPGEQALPFRV